MIESIIGIVSSILDKIIPDKAKAEQAKAELLLRAQEIEAELMKAQLEINKEEAKSDSLFVSGWRPFVGWVCGTAFAWQFLVAPVVNFIVVALGHPQIIIDFDITTLVGMLSGLLGFGALRTVEYVKGVSGMKQL